MNSSGKIPVEPEVAGSLKTIPIASGTGDIKSYHPSYRSLSVILDESPSQQIVQTLPSFLISESGPLRRTTSCSVTGRAELFFRVDNFDDAVAAYAEPLAD